VFASIISAFMDQLGYLGWPNWATQIFYCHRKIQKC